MKKPKPAIRKFFKIKLTRQQSNQVHDEWRKNYELGGAMIVGQPHASWGPFALTYGFINCGIVDAKLAEAISKTIERHKKSRPA